MDSSAASITTTDLMLHQNWLRSVVRSRVDHPDQVDDILSETFSDAFEHAQRPAKIENLGPWLYRVAIRKVLQWKRREGRFRKLKNRISEIESQEIDWDSNPIELILGNEKRDLVRQAVAQLSGRDAEILTLKYVHGWDYETISRNLGIPRSKIANRLRTARNNLKKQLTLLGLDSA